MKVVTATIVIRGNPAGQFSSQYEPRTIYQEMTSDAYRELVSASGKHRLDNTAGMPLLIDMAEVAAIWCGPERDE